MSKPKPTPPPDPGYAEFLRLMNGVIAGLQKPFPPK